MRKLCNYPKMENEIVMNREYRGERTLHISRLGGSSSNKIFC